MRFFFLFLAGLVGGVLGGMGFGGGTLLIPILTFFLSVPYRLAVWINLVVFLPTAVIALVIHSKNKMIEWKRVGSLLAIAVLGVIVGALLLGRLSDGILRFSFGIFLISVGGISALRVFIGYFRKKP